MHKNTAFKALIKQYNVKAYSFHMLNDIFQEFWRLHRLLKALQMKLES